VSPKISARLAALGIQLLADGRDYRLFAREGCVAFAHGDSPGSAGLMTDNGLAFLVWRGGQPFLAAKGSEVPAAAEQVDALRRFSEDLKEALTSVQ
jgi:hypothetical protein